jgi:hypothetical protein
MSLRSAAVSPAAPIMCLIGSGRARLAIAPGASVAPPIADGIAAPPNSSGSCQEETHAPHSRASAIMS